MYMDDCRNCGIGSEVFHLDPSGFFLSVQKFLFSSSILLIYHTGGQKNYQNAQAHLSSSFTSCLPLCSPAPVCTPSRSRAGRMQTSRILELFALYEKCSFLSFYFFSKVGK